MGEVILSKAWRVDFSRDGNMVYRHKGKMTNKKFSLKDVAAQSFASFSYPVLISLLILLVGWVGLNGVTQEIKDHIASQLQTTLSANIESLNIWIKNEKAVAETWAQERGVREAIVSLAEKTRKKFRGEEFLRNSPELLKLREILGPVCEKYNYIGFVVFDKTGRQVAALLEEPIGKTTLAEKSDFVERTLRGETVLSLPFHAETPLPNLKGEWKANGPTLFAAAPVYDQGGEIIGVLSFRHRPEYDFTNILATSRFGESGETYAFSRDGLMISDSRFNDHLRRMGLLRNHPDSRAILSVFLRQPPIGSNPKTQIPLVSPANWPLTRMAESAIKGESGVDVEGYRDYRGIPVVGAWTWLDEYGFGITTEIDADEALRPLVSTNRIFILVFTLLIGTLVAALVLKSHQRNVQLERALAEEKTRSVVANAQDAIITIYSDEIVESFNPAAEKLFGYSAEEVIGRNVKMLMPEPYRSEHSGYVKDYLTTGRAKILGIRREVPGVRSDGSIFDMELSASRMDLAGETMFIGIVRDITERKQSEEKLLRHAIQQEAVARFGEKALEGTNLPDLMNQVVRSLAHILDVEFIAILEMEQKERTVFTLRAGIGWLGKNGSTLRIPFDQASQAAYTIKNGQPIILENLETETRFVASGLLLDHHIVSGASVVIEGQHQPFGVLCVHSRRAMEFSRDDVHFLQSIANVLADAIGRLSAENLIRASESFLQTLARVSPVGIFYTDERGRVTYLNERWVEICGLSVQDFGGRVWTKTVHPQDRDRIIDEWEYTLKHDIPFRSEFRVKPGGKFTSWILGQVEAVRDSNGNVSGHVGTVTDISDRKRVEEQLQLYAAELERSNKDLEDFAFIASHDLQEPLRKVMIFGDRIKSSYASGQSDHRGPDYIERLQKSMSKMQRFIDDLLEFSRVTRKSNRFEKIFLENTIKEVLSSLEFKLLQTGASVIVKSLPTVYADKFQMEQLFQNLVSNALKFHRKDHPPLIMITSRKMDAGRWEISVQDNGIGFKQKYADRIFRPFERLHTPNEFEGSGMGLAICQKVVHHHQGKITAQSEPGMGSTFTILIPESPPETSSGEKENVLQDQLNA